MTGLKNKANDSLSFNVYSVPCSAGCGVVGLSSLCCPGIDAHARRYLRCGSQRGGDVQRDSNQPRGDSERPFQTELSSN